MPDYRCTKYEKAFIVDNGKKEELKKEISINHPKTNNHYLLIRPNEKPYKHIFAEIYHNKCAYCGLSTDLVPLQFFEIDHFIPKSGNASADLDKLPNLVLACKSCNSKKTDFVFEDGENNSLCFPDNNSINTVFARSNDYTITINDAYLSNNEIKTFYSLIHLGSQLKRLDYLIMSMVGLKRMLYDRGEKDISSLLGHLSDELIRKRNTVTCDSQVSDSR